MRTTHLPQKTTLINQAFMQVEGFAALYEKLKRKLFIADLSESTLNNYSRQLAHIALYYKRLPTELNMDEIERYLYYLKAKPSNISLSCFKHMISALRFVFRMEGMPEMDVRLPRIKRLNTLPVVLSKYEVVKLLNMPKKLNHRILIALLYGCGLRCFEVRNIKLSDLDFHRSVLHVRQGKGKKDRYVPLGNILVAEIKHYIEICKPKTWLFNGKPIGRKGGDFDGRYSQRGVQWAVKSAAKSAGIIKPINVHTLRHTFATHLLEDGLDIVSIKELLGHSCIQTTLVYLHVAQMSRKPKFSPIDKLEGVKINPGIQYKLDFNLDE